MHFLTAILYIVNLETHLYKSILIVIVSLLAATNLLHSSHPSLVLSMAWFSFAYLLLPIHVPLSNP